ncbi:MAG TPA: AsmA-like C-terminal region-containing protein [Gemmatimonadales bacterium]|nr:AsmA-like C-terminal region-containing protein [Gemmatimonadales bacterium]
MTRKSKLLKWIGGGVALLLALLLVLPLLFKGTIASRVKTAVNQNVNARVDWRDVGLTFFRHFPNLTLTLHDLSTVGVNKFQGDTLAAVRHLRVVLDLASVLGNVMGGKPVVIRAIELDQPRLRLITLEDGAASWDIVKKPAEQPAEAKASKPMAVSLRRLAISDAAALFDNRRAKLKATVAGYDQTLSGDFSQTNVAVRTKADADTVSVTYAGIPYLNKVKLALDADVQADLARKAYTIRRTDLSLNDLKLGVTGSAATAGRNTALDLAFKAPSTSFRSILSLIPAVYAHDFDKVKTSGTIAVDGKVQGEYGASAFPSFAVRSKVVNGAFQYPDLPLPARDIAVDLALTNPGGSADSTLVRLDRFHLRLGRNPVDARMTLRTPVSDPDLDARVTGKVDLADVHRTVKLEGIDQLAGTVAADAGVRTRMSYIDKKQYDRVNASGTVDVAGFTLKGKTLPHPLTITQASLALAPQRAQLKSFSGTIGSSDLQATGQIENLLAFALRDDTLKGTASIRSNRFNLTEWQSGGGDLQIIPVPPKIDFGLDATINRLDYAPLTMTNARGKLRVKDQRVTLEDFRVNTLGGEVAVTGFYETTDTTKPTFDVGLKMTRLDIQSAFKSLATVQALAPVAKYAVGQVSTDLKLNGALGKNMLPLFPGLAGGGALQTTEVELHDFPMMDKIVDVTKLQFLDNPTLQALKTAFQIKAGRLFVQPFDVKIGGTTLNVAGSNGLDQSLEYDLSLKVPRSMLGSAANGALSSLAAKAEGAGINLNAAEQINLGIKVGGTVTSPTVVPDATSLASSVKSGAEQAVKQAAQQKVDSAAARAVAEAEQKAGQIRAEGQKAADAVKAEGYRQADSLLARANNPFLKAAAKPAADQLRKQADGKAANIVAESNKRADDLVAEARRKAGQP